MLGSNRAIYPSYSVADAMFRAIDAGCIFLALYLASQASELIDNELFWLLGAMATVLFNVIGAFWRHVS